MKPMFIPSMIKSYGLPGQLRRNDFDLIEMDEARWYPDHVARCLE